MQKLLELLNQFDDEEGKDLYEWEIEWEDIIWYNRFWWWYETIDVSRSVIISKRYWFIERLVKKDKIDTNNLNLKVFKSMFSNDWTVEISYEELILMLLAISDEPIEYLISILK